MSAVEGSPRVCLQVENLTARYGQAIALRGVDFTAPGGRIVGMTGPNGAGKSTTLRVIAGVHSQSSGHVLVNGVDLRGKSAWRVARAGVSLVREGAVVFRTLTISENIAMGRRLASARRVAAVGEGSVYELFPALADRKTERADSLSGGQRQMLALATAIVSGPSVLLLDEPSAGLAWAAAAEVFDAISQLRTERMAIVIAEQSERWLERCADEVVALEMGHTQAAMTVSPNNDEE